MTRRLPRAGAISLCCMFLLLACAKRHSDAPATGASGARAELPAGTAGSGTRPAPDSVTSRVGARAIAKLEPIAAAPDDPNPLNGTAKFHVTPTGVDLAITIQGCYSLEPFPIQIKAGRDCSMDTLVGATWDGARGENIADIGCLTRTNGPGRSSSSRLNSDKKPWSIGKPSASNILGHALVVYDPKDLHPVACGEIVLDTEATTAPVAVPSAGSGVKATTEGRAVLAGLCLGRMIVRDNTQDCPNPAEIDKCATEHCDLDACVPMCSDFLACVQASDDPCQAQFECDISPACNDCYSRLNTCVTDFCLDTLACAAPVMPGGPCTKLEACCAMQGDFASTCFDTVYAIEKLSGDMSCYGAMHDWDFFSHLPVPCKFE